MADDWIYRVKSNTLQKRLFDALENDTLTDVTFQVGSTENQCTFKAHRLLLGAEIPKFENMFYRFPSGDIKIPDVHPKGFENLIRYCYGVCFRSPGDLSAIRETCLVAEKFRAPRLKLAVENNLLALVKSEPVIELLKFSIELKMPRLKERCLEVISSRFEKVLMTEELTSAPPEVMESILSLWPDHGREFKICALVALLRWVKKHKCPEDITSRLLSMVQDENIASKDVVSSFKMEIEQLTEDQLREVVKGFFSKEICSLKLSPSVESTDTFGNTVAVSPEGTVAKDEDEEMEQEPMLQEEAVIDEAKVLELKDEKEVADLKEASELNGEKEVADLKEASELKGDKEIADLKEASELKGDKEIADLKEVSELKGEKEIDEGDGSIDLPLVMKETMDQLGNYVSKLIENFISESSQRTEVRMTEGANKAIYRLTETMNKVIEGMINSFKKVYEAQYKEDSSKDQKAEITTAVLTEPSSSTAGDEGEHKIEDI